MRARPAKLVERRRRIAFIDPPGQRIALASDGHSPSCIRTCSIAGASAGAEILPFSPLADEAPDADADAIWLPGGYPELHAGTLAAASRFLDGLRQAAARSVAIHGECGGYMVLGQGLEDADGRRHAMAGAAARSRPRSPGAGCISATAAPGCVSTARWDRPGTEIMGHEFHYARTLSIGDEPLVDCRDVSGAVVPEAGARRGSVSGTFFHAISRGPS